MHDIHQHLIEGHLIHKLLKDKIEVKAREQQGKCGPKKVECTDIGEKIQAGTPIRKLLLSSPLSRYSEIAKSTVAASDYERFAKVLRMGPITPEGRGTTWLELYILYRMAGFQKPRKDDSNKARARGTVRQQLRMFKVGMRRVLRRILMDSPDLEKFRPAQQNLQPLLGLGIQGYLSMVNFRAAISEEAATSMKIHLLKLAHGMSEKKAKEFLAGRMQAAPKKLVLKGYAAWDSKIAHVKHIFGSHVGSQAVQGGTGQIGEDAS
eukprot:12407610-Karenia_brevis.AAC.1